MTKEQNISITISILIIRELTVSLSLHHTQGVSKMLGQTSKVNHSKTKFIHPYICQEMSVGFVVTERLHSTTNIFSTSMMSFKENLSGFFP